MKVHIEIAAWKSEGLRCPDIAVDLRTSEPRPRQVTLVQMPNGTGKTTTLELLKATLSGSARYWEPDEVRAFRRTRDKRQFGTFEVTLLVDSKPLTIELMLNYRAGQVGYRTTNPGSGGIVSQYYIPPALGRFLSHDFLSLFIFDGEFAGRLLDDGKTEADQVVDRLCQIYLLEEASSFAYEYWRTSAKTDTTKSQTGLDKIKRDLSSLENKEKDLERELEDTKLEIGSLQEDIQEFNEQIRSRVSTVEGTRQQHAEAEADREKAKHEVAIGRKELMDALRLPHALHPVIEKRLIKLHENLERLRLPENTSAQFFRELVDEDTCICGRPMDELAAREITTRADRYLDDDDAGVINALKRDIERYTRQVDDLQEDAGHRRTLRLRDSLAEVVRVERQAGQRVRILTERLIREGDKELKQWMSAKEEKEVLLEKCNQVVEAIEGKGDSNTDPLSTRSLKVVRESVKATKDRIAQLEGTVRLRRQTELIQSMLKSAGIRAREHIKQQLVEMCNDRLSIILENDPLTIERIDRSIKLFGQRGASAGQTLAIGYAFLMTVLNRGKNNFPFIVDSPAGPIDTVVRRHIGRLLPQLCSQFVGFTINTEREAFADVLAKQVPDIRLLTIFRKTAGTRHILEALPQGRFSETENAVLVDDKDYFFDFDIEEEEENAVQTA